MTFKRKCITILLILTTLYVLIGFFLLPFLVRHFGEKALQEHVNEASVIEKVRFNPFTLRLVVEGLQTEDAEGVWSAKLQLVEIDVSGLSFVKFHPIFDRIALDGLDVSIARRDTPADTATVEGSPAGEASGGWQAAVQRLNVVEIPKLQIDLLEVTDGRAEFTDETNATVYSQSVDPINFTLRDLTTVSQGATTMQFLAETETGATLSWQGNLSSKPLQSSGRFSLTGLKINDLSPYYAEMIRFNLDSAVFGVEFDYAMDLSNLEDLFALTNGQLALTEVVCEPLNAGDRILSIDSVMVEGVGFHFPQMELGIERIGISRGNTLVRRDADGAINLLGLLAERQVVDADAESVEPITVTEENALPPFTHRIDLIEMIDYTVVWEEDLSQGLAQVTVGIPTLQVRGLSSDLEKPFEIEATYTFGESGVLKLLGEITSGSGAFDLGLNLQDFRLDAATAYTKEFADLKVESGQLDFDGRLLNDADQGVRVTGTASIYDFAASQGIGDATLFSWSSLRVEALDYGASPFGLNIESIRLVEPLVSMSRQPSVEREAPLVEVADEASSESSVLDVVINSIQIESGRFVFNDQSVEPSAEMVLSELNIGLENLHLSEPEIARLQIDGRLNESALELTGELNPGALKSATQLQLKLDGLRLPQFSPYSGQAVGRRIDQGVFSLTSDWSIVESQLKASNAIVIDQLNFGDSVKSDSAVSLPLDLAVALLAGPSGKMDLSLPLTGDLTDPKVSIGQVVRTAIVGLVTNVAAAPFKLLSGLVGSEEDLSVVEFDAGESTLSNVMIDRLNMMATALKERPDLKLKIVPEISPKDLRALKEAQFRAQLLPESSRGNDAAYHEALKERYREQVSADVATNPSVTQMVIALSASVELSDEALSGLANARTQTVREHLETSHGLDASRLELAESETVEDGVGLRFELK